MQWLCFTNKTKRKRKTVSGKCLRDYWFLNNATYEMTFFFHLGACMSLAILAPYSSSCGEEALSRRLIMVMLEREYFGRRHIFKKKKALYPCFVYVHLVV